MLSVIKKILGKSNNKLFGIEFFFNYYWMKYPEENNNKRKH